MTDTSGGATNPFAGLAASMGGNGGAVDPRLTDPEFFMHYPEVGKFANQVASHGQALTDASTAIKNIHLPMGTFGVIGGGLNGVHSKLRDQAADAIAKGKGVLDSWKLALDKAVENAKEGEKESSGKTGKGGPDGLGGGTKGAGLPKGLGLGGGGLPKTGPGSGLGTDWKLPKDKLGTDLDDSLKHPDLPDSSTLPGPGGSGADLPSPGDPNGNGLDPNGAGGNGLGGSGLDQNGLNGDGLDRNAVNPQMPTVPGDTALSAHTPTPPTVPTLPDPGTSGYGPTDYSTGTRTGTGGTGSGAYGSGGYGSGGYGTGASTGSAGRTGIGAGGMPGVPYAPMAGAGNSAEDKDRQRGPAVPEDESTWFGEEDVAPAVLGMQEED